MADPNDTIDDMILSTRRLTLRFQRESDIEFLVSLWTDEQMTQYTGGPRDRSFLLEEFKRIAEDPRREEFDLWPIELNETRAVIGQAGFIPKELGGKEYIELNYYIESASWGNGYAKEIAQALVEYAFSQKKLPSVIAIIDPGNEASIAVAKAIGMQFWMDEERSGRRKSIYVIENRRHDS